MSNLILSTTHNESHYPGFAGINPLVAAAMPLLLLLIKFKNTDAPDDISQLRQQVINEIANFETRAKTYQCSPRLILAARYCLCTALDEVVLLTAWGSHSVWAHQTLLSLIHKETWGGERFFIILDKMAQEPKQNLPLLELIYLLLSFGFEGKYYNEEKAVRAEIRNRLFQLIMMQKDKPHRKLSPSLKLMQKTEVSATQAIPKWKIALATTGTLFLLGLIFNIATYFSDYKILQELNDISLNSAATHRYHQED